MRTYNLLVAEDDDEMREFLVRMLQSLGHAVCAEADGSSALERLRKRSFDLLILDIKMPGIDGFQLLRIAKESYPRTKVIMVTGYSDLHHALEAKRLGADDFIGKPYDLIELDTSIQRVLRSLPSAGSGERKVAGHALRQQS
jgi:DNA-binding response OmpR family regulator